ncbi:MAG: methyltransferase domain-containing protein [Candidatus Lokiarchaeota archaeon]|nr:methyltransferase domain-containing protein [Candidatus Lokiarchaeota archaeon]
MSRYILKDEKLRNYYEKEGLNFSLNDYYIGVYRFYSSHACRIAVIKKWLKLIKPGETFCELGCGFGYFTHFVAKRGNHSVGIDISKNKIKIAERIAEKNQLDCDFHRMDIQKMKFKNDSFDWVLSSQVLEHLPDDMKALSEIFCITKKYSIITVPKRGLFWNLFDKTSHIRSLEELGHGHFREYSTENLIEKIKRVGFKVLKVKYAGFISPRIDLIFRHIPFMQAIICLLLIKSDP